MKIETPILIKAINNYETEIKDESSSYYYFTNFICADFIRKFFGRTPKKIILVFSDKYMREGIKLQWKDTKYDEIVWVHPDVKGNTILGEDPTVFPALRSFIHKELSTDPHYDYKTAYVCLYEVN